MGHLFLERMAQGSLGAARGQYNAYPMQGGRFCLNFPGNPVQKCLHRIRIGQR